MPTTPETWLEEFPVSPATPVGTATLPSITQLANGNIVVTWTEPDDGVSGDGTEVMAQIYDPVGTPVGAPFQINQASTGDNETTSTVVALSSGGFIVVYHDVNLAGDGGSNIRLEEFDSAGAPVSETSMVLNDTASGALPNYSQPTAASSSSTSVLIVFTEDNGATSEVQGVIYNPTTNSYGSVFTVMSGAETGAPAVTVLSNGNYVIATRRDDVDDAIVYRILSPTGSSVLSATFVSQTNTNTFSDRAPAMAALAGGGFVISYVNEDSNDIDVRYHIYNAAGTQLAAGTVGTGSADDHNEPVVAGLSDGTFVIVYDDDGNDVMELARYEADGSLMGKFTFSGPGASPVVTDLGDGRFAVAWRQIGGANEVVMEIFDTRDLVNAPTYTPDQWQIATVGNDVFTSGGSAEVVHAWDGNDTVTESTGGSEYYMGAGNDSLVVTSIIQADVHHGGLGVDSIDWTAVAEDGATFDLKLELATDIGGLVEAMIGFENLIGTGFGDTIIGNGANNRLQGFDGTDTVSGGGGNDSLFGGSGADRLNGGIGFDTVDGGVDNDELQGLDGFDTLGGGSGDDLLQGNAGSDLLQGGTGNDTLQGGNSGDTLQGDEDNDLLEGADGADQLSGGTGHDALFGNAGADGLNGGEGNDTLSGGINGDTLFGDEGNDTLSGDDGADSLFGGSGNDLVQGNAGSDVVRGDAGSDTLTGGIGADIFVFDDGADRVTDFQNNIDELHFDDSLWGNAVLSIPQILGFASVVGGNVVFDFGGGDVLTVVGVTNIDSLSDDISFF